jgi:hypothetical protein
MIFFTSKMHKMHTLAQGWGVNSVYFLEKNHKDLHVFSPEGFHVTAQAEA